MNIYRVEIRVGDGALVAQMSNMREWLDSRRMEPLAFRYDQVDGTVVIRVDFANEDDAAAMASRHGGLIVR